LQDHDYRAQVTKQAQQLSCPAAIENNSPARLQDPRIAKALPVSIKAKAANRRG